MSTRDATPWRGHEPSRNFDPADRSRRRPGGLHPSVRRPRGVSREADRRRRRDDGLRQPRAVDQRRHLVAPEEGRNALNDHHGHVGHLPPPLREEHVR